MNIILEKPITKEEAYTEITGNGSFLKVFNKNLNAELAWCPTPNTIEMHSIFDDEVMNEEIELKSFEQFITEFPSKGWYIGHIED